VLSKIYLDQRAIDELISRTSFRAPTLNPVTAPGVLPHGAATTAATALLSGCNVARRSCERSPRTEEDQCGPVHVDPR